MAEALRRPAVIGPGSGPRTLAPAQPKLTHLDKVYFPAFDHQPAITKGELLEYNREFAPLLLPHLRDRPYTMKRFPEGITAPAFFQKEAGARVPAWVRTAAMPSGTPRGHINFILCNDLPTLLYVVNAGCIDHNIWLSRYQTPLEPDFVLLDLDPGPKAGFGAVIGVAQAIRRTLERFDIAGYVKTSGATGIHVWIPIAPGHSFTQTQQFAALLLRLAAGKVPQLVTEDWSLGRRPRDKVYLDYRQNARGHTIPPPYSPRPHPGAPVSCPLHWSEVRRGLDPGRFTIRSMRRRLDRLGEDLFAGALPGAGHPTLQELLERIRV